MSEINRLDLAGASQDRQPVKPDVDTAREIFPVSFENDYKDFRGVEQPSEGAVIPKSSSAPASVETPKLPTGLEDVSEDDLGNPVLTSVEKDKNQTSSMSTGNTSQISSEAS